MNGEVKSYCLNSPMNWKSFKAMPDDIKVLYIRGIRERYGVENTKISEMLGIHKVTFANEIKRLGLKNGGKREGKADSDGWFMWIHGIPEDRTSDIPSGIAEQESQKEDVDKEIVEAVEENKSMNSALPAYGQLDFECNARAALQVLDQILQDSCVKLTVAWKLVGDGVQHG